MPATTAQSWAGARTFHHSDYSAALIAAEREQAVSVVLPARECAATVGEVVERLCELVAAGAVDEVLVVDAASADGTAEVARRAGATVVQESELLPEQGPVLGKGDAMWRALSAARGELVCFLDADTEGFSEHFAVGLLGPLVREPAIGLVKGFYRRPLGGAAEGGGRVNHLTAHPALSVFYPELGCVRQPLAGEAAARRELLEAIPFVTGYGVEIAMLIDAWRELGLEGLAQVDLEEHRNPHKPLRELAGMAETVLATVASRLRRDGRLDLDVCMGGVPVERPPLAALRAT